MSDIMNGEAQKPQRSRAPRGARAKRAVARFDGMTDPRTGRGTVDDKLGRVAPQGRQMSPAEARQWYISNGFLQTVIDAPGQDATREWVSIECNHEGVDRLLLNRLSELQVQARIARLVQYSRLYQQGGFLYFGVQGRQPLDDRELSLPVALGDRLEFINVIGPDHVAALAESLNPLSRSYHDHYYLVYGRNVDSSRLWWMCRNYLPEEQRGVSMTETVLDPVVAQDTALWAVASVVYELSAKVFKSPAVNEMSPEKLQQFLAGLRATLSAQGAVALDSEESLTRLESGVANGAGLEQLLGFIVDNLAGVSQIPKSRLTGQAQGVITAGQYDLLSYYDSIAKFQEIELKPLLEKIITLIVHERDGEVSRHINGAVESLDWEIKFNSLWKVGPVEESEIGLRSAQRDEIYVQSGVLGPDEVRRDRFGELEAFRRWQPPEEADGESSLRAP